MDITLLEKLAGIYTAEGVDDATKVEQALEVIASDTVLVTEVVAKSHEIKDKIIADAKAVISSHGTIVTEMEAIYNKVKSWF